MRSAYRPETLDRRSLGLSIGIHALLLLLLLLSSRQQHNSSPELETPVPPLTLDVSTGPPEQASVDMRKPAPAPGENRTKPHVSDASGKPAPAAPTPVAEAPVQLAVAPVVQPSVQPIVQLPVLTPEVGGAPVPGTATTTGGSGTGTGTGSGKGGAGSGAGGGGGGSGGDSIAERPDWIEKPTDGERMMVLSSSAFSDHANGWAVLSCLVTRSKTVHACKVLAESADSQGHHRYAFGKSALQLSQYFRIRPPMRNGQPRYDLRVRIPVYWNWD
jgi:hypothetical protein